MKSFVRLFVSVLTICLFVFAVSMTFNIAHAKLKDKCIEGGQNQLEGVEGSVGKWVFNGTTKLIVTKVDITENGPNGEKPEAGKKWVAIFAEIKNAHKFTSTYGGPFQTMDLVDKDENLVEGVKSVKKADWTKQEDGKRLLPAAGLKAVFAKRVDSDYAPVRLIFHPGGKEPVIRVKI